MPWQWHRQKRGIGACPPSWVNLFANYIETRTVFTAQRLNTIMT